MYRQYCIDIGTELSKLKSIAYRYRIKQNWEYRVSESLNLNLEYRAHLWSPYKLIFLQHRFLKKCRVATKRNSYQVLGEKKSSKRKTKTNNVTTFLSDVHSNSKLDNLVL